MSARKLSLSVVSLAAIVLLGATLADAGAAKPRWLKGNLHTHSLWSDGNDFPEMIADWYRQNGYQFLALSDHNILSSVEKWIEADLPVRRGGRNAIARCKDRFGGDWIETRRGEGEGAKLEVRLRRLDEFRALFEAPDEFLMIQAEEISDAFEGLPLHVNATNLAEVVRPQGGTSVRDVIANNLRAVDAQSERFGRPMLAHLNHPNFYWAITAEDLAAVVDERWFEVYNGHPSVNHLGDETHASVERLWDIANTIRVAELGAPPLWGLAADDSHNYFNATGSTPGRGWVMVRSEELTPDAVVAALRRGDFYASSGVSLSDVRFEGGELAVDIEPDGGATFETRFVGTLEDYDATSTPVLDAEGNEVRATRRYSADVGRVLATAAGATARYRLTGRELWVRAVVTSSEAPANPVFEGQRAQAWTQPVGWEDRVARRR
jgi:hypothetical protein